MLIEYRVNVRVTPEELAGVFARSGIRRPADDTERLQRMITHATLLVTAWHEQTLVGVARALTDFSYCCYLSDLAVDSAYQKRGIGGELIEKIKQAIGTECNLILLAAPDSTGCTGRDGLLPKGRFFRCRQCFYHQTHSLSLR